MPPTITPGHIRTNVADSTGVDGGYDFSISPAGIVRQTSPAAKSEGSEAGEASGPSGGFSL